MNRNKKKALNEKVCPNVWLLLCMFLIIVTYCFNLLSMLTQHFLLIHLLSWYNLMHSLLYHSKAIVRETQHFLCRDFTFQKSSSGSKCILPPFLVVFWMFENYLFQYNKDCSWCVYTGRFLTISHMPHRTDALLVWSNPAVNTGCKMSLNLDSKLIFTIHVYFLLISTHNFHDCVNLWVLLNREWPTFNTESEHIRQKLHAAWLLYTQCQRSN